MLFFGAYTNGTVVRLDPPCHSVFNYLVSYELETDAAVRYPMKLEADRRRRPAGSLRECGVRRGPKGSARTRRR